MVWPVVVPTADSGPTYLMLLHIPCSSWSQADHILPPPLAMMVRELALGSQASYNAEVLAECVPGQCRQGSCHELRTNGSTNCSGGSCGQGVVGGDCRWHIFVQESNRFGPPEKHYSSHLRTGPPFASTRKPLQFTCQQPTQPIEMDEKDQTAGAPAPVQERTSTSKGASRFRVIGSVIRALKRFQSGSWLGPMR